MRANCVICSDLFDEINSISVAPCGHTYHSTCLTLWIGESKTCPECRARIGLKDIKKIFFNFLPKSDFNSSELENEIANLKGQLSAKDLELAACKKQKDDTVAFVRDAEKRASDLQQIVYKNEYELSELRMRVKSISKLEAKVLKLEQMNAAMTNDMQHLNNVQMIVNGTQKDVDDILREYTERSEASKQLATYCTCLKRELQKVIESKNKLLELNTKLKRENGRFAAKVKFYEDALALSGNKTSKTFGAPSVPSNSTPLKATPAKANPSCSSENSSLSANAPSTSKQITICEEVDMSPLSVTFNKTKFNMCIKSSSTAVYKSNSGCQSNVKYTNIAPLAAKKQNDDDISVIRTGYNGLGGHCNFISKSGIKKLKTSKKM